MPKNIIRQRAARPFSALLPATGQAGLKHVSGKPRWLQPLAILCCMVNALSAHDFETDVFYCFDNGTSITITGYKGSGGNVDIPAKIPPDTGKLVTTIGYGAFDSCSLLTSVTIPSSVTSIEGAAFTYCDGLKSVTIPVGVTSIGNGAFSYCSGLMSVAIPVGVTTIGVETFYACSGLESVKIPSSVTSIGNTAFGECSTLASVTIPAGVISIGASAFQGCRGLTRVVIAPSVTSIGDSAFASCDTLSRLDCLGNAPGLGTDVFYLSNINTLYHFDDKTGFDVVPWNDYTHVSLGASTAVATWLLLHGFTPATDILTDPNHDGVSLLMAYALNLDPQENLAGSLPKPVIDGTHLSLTFYAANTDVSYAVESSFDLQGWSTADVTLPPDPDGNNCRTATVDRAGHSACFMRLVVEQR